MNEVNSTLLRVNARELLRFFDEKPENSVGDASAVVAVAGEDLAAALFKHYVESSQGGRVLKIAGTPTTKKSKGPRLDRWIHVAWANGSRQLFQAEIKSWSAHAIGGRVLKIGILAWLWQHHRQGRQLWYQGNGARTGCRDCRCIPFLGKEDRLVGDDS